MSGSWRLFVAVDIGDEVRAEVARVRATIQGQLEAVKQPPRVLWVAPQSLHVTLRFLGETPSGEVDRLREVLAAPFSIAPFEVEWRGIGAFPLPRRPKALWMGVVSGALSLGDLEAEVSRRIDRGRVEDARPFRPHLTLGRVKVPGAGVDWAEVLQHVEVRGARSFIDRVTLYRSALSPKGPHYTGLISSPLTK